ncbi:MAG TPA: HAMP domain-containing sensor histidine kinase [Actinomycetota bacterium]|nr:HAMP domain-containing sensor histidine kinase [Actinomycetota bacterium]
MGDLRRRPGLLLASAFAVLVAIGAHRAVSLGDISALLPISAGLFAGACSVAAVAYPDRRDPALLLVSAGAGGVAAQYLLWAVLIPLAWSTTAPHAFDVRVAGGVYGSIAGAFALAVCLALTVPWRDRRGRPPLRPLVVGGTVAASLALVDLVVLVVQPTAPAPAIMSSLVVGVPVPTVAVVAAAGLVVIAATAATVRTAPRPGWYRWVAGCAASIGVAAAGTALLYLVNVRWVTEVAIAWQAAMPAVAAGLLLVGALAAGRADATQMRRATDRAEAVLAGRSEIASVIAHDVRGPASSIKSIASSMRTNYARLGDAERLEFVGMIEAESGRLLQLVGQMSLALKVDAGSIEVRREVRPLGPIVAKAVHDAEITDRPVELETEEDAEADVDARWLQEAIGQALDNAVKFSPAGGQIRVSLMADGTDAVIQIADDGPGVPPEVRDQVFQKFARWRPSGYEDRPGSGLGLFITRSLVRQQDGDVVLGSTAGGGTILRIRVPRKG